jgi:uroporphyrin-III C-methyltransferase/precorrin-2 dehydrogenase/sirohydrochlorin ferrochelatase
MDYLPIFIDVRARECLVVGGGEVAARKIELLQRARANVRVVAPALCPQLAAAVAAGELTAERREYAAADLDRVWLVIAATSSPEVNARVAADAGQRSIPVNVVDAPLLCTFVMPAIVDRSPVLVAVSTAGASPVLARLTRARIEVALPERLGQLANFASRFRATVKGRVADAAQRRALWETVLDGEIGQLVLAGDDDGAARALEQRLAQPRSVERGRLSLLGAGTGELDRLPLGAVRALGSADVIMHEAAALAVVSAIARRDAARELIDGLSGPSVLGAEAPNALAVRVEAHVAVGRHVCMVRMGDPFADPDSIDLRDLRRIVPRLRILRPSP